MTEKNNRNHKNYEKNVKRGIHPLPVITAVVVIAAAAVFAGTRLFPQKEAAGTDASSASSTDNNGADNGSSGSTDNSTSDSTSGGGDTVSAQISDGVLVVDAGELSEDVSFVDYDSNGTRMQLMLVKDEDGTVRGAFNTCQVCNGSPYAYFVQSGDYVICQNCKNSFPLSAIGIENSGCNPIPMEFTQDGDSIQIDTDYLDSYASLFITWKKGI